VDYYYFSDDSVGGIRCVDGFVAFNSDFKKADSSADEPVFDILEEAISVDNRFAKDIKGALAQCRLPITITNPEDPREKVKVFPVTMKGLSGNIFTVLFNNTGQIMFCGALFELLSENPTCAEVESVLHRAASMAGYVLDLKICKNLEDLDFLKTTPVVNTDGKIDAIDCLGSLLKSLGSCAGNMLPGLTKTQKFLHKIGYFGSIGTFELRARLYTSEVYRGKVHSGNHVVLEALRSKIMSSRMDISTSKYAKDQKFNPIALSTDGQLGYCDSSSIGRRYGLTGCEIEELADLIRVASFGQRINHTALNKIFSRDYDF
jgi:hypothetical protein